MAFCDKLCAVWWYVLENIALVVEAFEGTGYEQMEENIGCY